MFIVINPAGELATIDAPADADTIRAAVGDFDLVRLASEPRMYAFVNDDGHLLGLDRNPVGACVIASLGGRPAVYVGPIAITGWEYPSEDSEIRDLASSQVALLTGLHGYVLQALAGEDFDRQRWAASVREYAEHVRTAPAPTLTFIPLGAFLRRQAANR